MKQSLPYSSNKSNKYNNSIKDCNSSIIDLKGINNDKNISYKKLVIRVLNRIAVLLPVLVVLLLFSIYFTYNFIYFSEIINLKQNNALNDKDNINRNSINSDSTICSSLITCINIFITNNYLNDISIKTYKSNDTKNTSSHSNTTMESSGNNQFNFYYYYNIISNNKSFIFELSFITFTFIIMVISFFRAWLSNPGFVVPGKNSIKIEYDNDSVFSNTSNSISSKKTETIAEQVIYYEDILKKQYNILISNALTNEYKKIKEAIQKANNNYDLRNNIDEENLSLLQSNNNYNSSDSNNNDIRKRKEHVNNKEKQNLIREIKRLIASSNSRNTKIDIMMLNEKDKQTNDIRLCLKCDIVKPDRSHHCLNCKSCVLTCDHHCPWVNNCIGYNNYKFFYCLIVYSMITSVSFAYRYNSFMVFWINMKETVNLSFLCFIVFYIIMIVISICLFLFNTYHLMLICNNMTTYEYSIYSKTENDYKYLLNNKYHKYFINCFGNIKNALGSNILIWVLPINKSIIKNDFTEVLKDNRYVNTRNSNCDSKNKKLTNEDFAYIYEAIHDNDTLFFDNEAVKKGLFSNGVNHKICERHLLEKKKSM